MRRKSRRVVFGKRQSLETHYLFNFLLDVLDNLEVRKEQEKCLSKMGKYNVNVHSLIAEIQ